MQEASDALPSVKIQGWKEAEGPVFCSGERKAALVLSCEGAGKALL